MEREVFFYQKLLNKIEKRANARFFNYSNVTFGMRDDFTKAIYDRPRFMVNNSPEESNSDMLPLPSEVHVILHTDPFVK